MTSEKELPEILHPTDEEPVEVIVATEITEINKRPQALSVQEALGQLTIGDLREAFAPTKDFPRPLAWLMERKPTRKFTKATLAFLSWVSLSNFMLPITIDRIFSHEESGAWPEAPGCNIVHTKQALGLQEPKNTSLNDETPDNIIIEGIDYEKKNFTAGISNCFGTKYDERCSYGAVRLD